MLRCCVRHGGEPTLMENKVTCQNKTQENSEVDIFEDSLPEMLHSSDFEKVCFLLSEITRTANSVNRRANK